MSDERNPWSIRGVSREARAKAAKAARRRRMTMGSWVDYVLSTAAHAELSNRGPQGAPEPDAEGVESADAEARADTIEAREQALRAMARRAADRALVPAEPAGPAVPALNGAPAGAMTAALTDLVERIEGALRPAAQVGALMRRLDEADRRQMQMLELMARMVEADQRREAEMARLSATLARLEARLGATGDPAPALPALVVPEAARPFAMPEDAGPRAQPLDYAALTEKAIANSRRSGQRPPAEAGGLADRLFGRKAD